MKKTPTGLKYQEVKEGKGEKPADGQTCEMHYTGWRSSGSGRSLIAARSGSDVRVPPRRGVIKGWDEGVASMKVGGKRLLLIPPELGYAHGGRDPAGCDAPLRGRSWSASSDAGRGWRGRRQFSGSDPPVRDDRLCIARATLIARTPRAS